MQIKTCGKRRRFVAALLPRWPTDRLRRLRPSLERHGAPLVLYEKAQNALRLYAIDARAEALGLFEGQPLTDARAMCPEVIPVAARPEDDAGAFAKLAERFIRYSPMVSIHRVGEAFIDITGCANLFGGEGAILRDIQARLAKAGFASQAAIAETAGGAWALACYGRGGIIPTGEIKRALSALPVEALRIDDRVAEALRRLGLKRIGQLYDMPRAPLTTRFTKHLLARLGQVLGTEPEPLTLIHPAPEYFSEMKVAEPVASLDAVSQCLGRLCGELGGILARAGRGGKRFEFSLFRVDNDVMRLSVGASQAANAPAHINRLFKNKLDDLGSDYDAGFGFEQFRLSAFETEPLTPQQCAAFDRDGSDAALAELKDRLSNRLGAARVGRLAIKDSHLPERADGFVSIMAPPPAPVETDASKRRPIKLLPRPEAIEAIAQVPDGPPARFTWRKVSYAVARASGPERISDEWWREKTPKPTRDYYRIETQEGRRYWIFREGLYGRETASPKWYLHGFFA